MTDTTHADGGGERWYVVRTQARAESKAQFNLLAQGFDVYLPQYRKRRSHARRIDSVRAPLFPRYAFVRMDLTATQWRAIRSTIGIADLVMNGGRPAAVADGIIDEIRAREDRDGLVALAPRIDLRPGDTVRITEGAFADRVGLFEGLSDEQRVVLLLDVLGRKVQVSVPVEDLVAAL